MKNKRIIKNNFEFQKIISYKRVVKDPSFVLYFTPSEKGYLEYGISVGKKIGNAVVRNRIKRQARNLIYQGLNEYGNKPYRIIMIVRPHFLSQSFVKNGENLKKILAKLK